MASLTFGILTVSDTCFHKKKEDTASPRLQIEIAKSFPSCNLLKKIVPDEITDIKSVLQQWIDSGCNVIFTVGGTGFSPRDVTPEATRKVIQREAPGIAYAMLSKSLAITDMAMLSRAVAGISSKTLIINFPGSAKAAVECFGLIKNVIPHAIALITDQIERVTETHKIIQDENVEKPKEVVPKTSKVKLNNAANRKRKSPYPMLSVSEAQNKILEESIRSVEREEINFDESVNRVLAEDIYAEDPIPPFRASIKDGYAVIAADGAGERIVKNVTAAGDKPCDEKLKPGEVIRISTGAPIPLGADAVVQVEDTTLIEKSDDGTQELKVNINVQPRIGQDIREIGSDIAQGELVLEKFARISPIYIGIFAMLGKTKIKVFKRKTIGIISTGNELKDPHEQLKPGQIRDSNKYALTHLLKRYSYDSNNCGTATDDPNSVKYALQKAAATNDIIITTGGVSMGEYDVVKDVLEEDFDAVIHFGRVDMKPGKPTTFASFCFEGQTKMVFALPGNPVSCCVTSLLFVIPTLRYLERNRKYEFPTIFAEGAHFVSKITQIRDRPEYRRVKVIYNGNRVQFEETGNQISSRLNSLAGANGLVLIPKHPEPFNSLTLCSVLIFDDL